MESLCIDTCTGHMSRNKVRGCRKINNNKKNLEVVPKFVRH